MSVVSLIQVNAFVNNTCAKRCECCFYPRGADEMTDEMAIGTVKWMLNGPTAKSYFIDILGGEPLESFDKALLMVDYLITHTYPSQTHFGLTAMLNTNGDLLTKDHLLAMKGRRMGISLNPTHDPISILKEKAALIRSVFGGCRLAIVLDEFNMARIEELTKLALEYHLQIRTNSLYLGAKDPEYIKEYKKACVKMLNLILESKQGMHPHMLIGNTIPIPRGNFGNGQVGYCVMVDPNGSIRICQPDMEEIIGNIQTHSLIDVAELCSHTKPGCHRWHTDNVPECQGCQWEELCRGGCPYTRKVAYGTYDKPSPYCSTYKELFPILMKVKERYEKINS